MPRVGLDTEAVVRAAAALADEDGLAALTLAGLAAGSASGPHRCTPTSTACPICGAGWPPAGRRELAQALRAAVAGRAGPMRCGAWPAPTVTIAHAHPGIYEAMQRAPEAAGVDADAARELIEVILAALAGYRLPRLTRSTRSGLVRSALHGFVTLEARGGFPPPGRARRELRRRWSACSTRG